MITIDINCQFFYRIVKQIQFYIRKMGQSNLERIQSSIVDLTDNGQISRQQAQFFLKDYIASGQSIKDINYFMQNKSIDLFLKYFINTAYVHKSAQSSQNGCGSRTAQERNQVRLGNKIMETGCSELNERVKYLINDVKAIYLSDRPEMLSVRQKIKDYIISYLEIQSYRYYYYKSGTMKETNSKILYLYDTSHESDIFNYAASSINSNEHNANLDEIVKQKYLNFQNFCLQFREGEALHIVIIEINMEKWKYSKSVDEKNIKQIMKCIFAPLANRMIDIYDTRPEGRDLNYKNFFTDFTLTLMENFVYLESKRIQYLVSQIKYSTEKGQAKFMEKIQSNKQCILRKIRRWKQAYSASQKLLILSFSKKKTLQFIFQNDESTLQLKYYKSEILQIQPCLSFFLDGNKKKIKKVLKSYQRLSNQKIVFSENIMIKISYDSSSTDQKTLTLLYFFDRGNQKPKNFKKNREAQSFVEKENAISKRVNFQKSQNNRIEQIGWFRDFLKEESEKSLTQSKRLQRKNVMKLPKLNKVSSFRGSYLEQDLKEKIDVDDQNTNLLTFPADKLEIFVLKVFSKLPFFQQLPHQNDQFPKFLREIHCNYEKYNNKFHNFIHGVNVMHTCYLLTRCSKNQEVLTEFDKFIIVFSGLCHDVGHTGFTNLFEIARQSDIAITYNNRSPLQMYHTSQAFEILKKPCNNFLSSLSQKEFARFRKLTISSILYTDIKEHFNLMKKFENRKETLQEEQDITVLAGMIIHASDFGGSVKNFQVCKKWSLLVNEQFTNQYKEQGRLGLTQTPFMKDLQKMHILAKNQLGFLKVIVHPLYRELNVFYEDDMLKRMVRNVENNIKLWENYIQIQSQVSEKQGNKREKV